MIGKLDLYRVFLEVCKNDSFSKAAQQLFMTQPAISQAIAQLEKELETKLFLRSRKGVTLTKEGHLLRDYVSSAIGILEVGEGKVLEFKNLTSGELRIGVGDTIARYYLLPYLETFYKRYPNIKLKVLNGTTSEILQLIQSGEAEVGICNLPVENDTLHVQPCKEVQDIFVCGEKYRNMAKEPVDISFLVKMPLIFLEKNANSRKYVEDYLKEKGYTIAPEFELGSHDLLLEFAKINLGIACVTKEFCDDELIRGRLFEIQLTAPIPKRHIGVVTLKNVPLSRATKKFVEMVQLKMGEYYIPF